MTQVNTTNTETDIENLRRLSYFYYFSEALNALVLLIALVIISSGRFMMYFGAGSLALTLANQGIEETATNLVNEFQIAALFPIILILGSIFALLAITGLVSGYFAGKYQRAQKHHTFCLIMAGLTAASFPIGTIIGVPTFFLLLREPVKARFAANDASKAGNTDSTRMSLLSNLFILYGIVGIVLSLVPLIFAVASFALLTGDFDKAIVVRGSQIPWEYLASGLTMVIFGLAFSVCAILAGRFLKKRTGYVFCIVISALLSLFAPFGTILGVWGLFLLFSDPGRAAFRTNK